MNESTSCSDRLSTERLPNRGRNGPWQLEITNTRATQTVVFARGKDLIIGSSSAAQVRVDDPTVSGLHARLSVTSQGLEVSDLGSTNGIHIGGARVPVALLDGRHCGFVIGRTTVSVYPVSESQPVSESAEVPGLVGRSLPMRRLAQEIRRFATLSAPVLLQGESGTGKEVVARALHQLSGRSGEFVALNVGGLNESLSDAELFGYRKGAFTGAVANHSGAFERARQGTLLLDEIADLDPSVQVKLLRVIEDGQVRPLGSQQAFGVDVRVVSACWMGLEGAVQAEEFREDLYHRISRITLHIPSLRQRLADVPLLAENWLQRFSDEFGSMELTSAAMAKLLQHQWPGNVRELGSVLYRACALVEPGQSLVELRHVESALPSVDTERRRSRKVDAQRLLEVHEGNISAAARAAKVPRTTFRSWLKASGFGGSF